MNELILEQKVHKIIMACIFAISYVAVDSEYYQWVIVAGMLFFIIDMIIGERQHRFIKLTYRYSVESKKQLLGMVRAMQTAIDIVEDHGDRVLLHKVGDEILPILEKVAYDAEESVKPKGKIV